MKRLFRCLANPAAPVLGVIACEPPEPPLPDYVGVWDCSDVPTLGFHYDLVFTLRVDGTYESLL